MPTQFSNLIGIRSRQLHPWQKLILTIGAPVATLLLARTLLTTLSTLKARGYKKNTSKILTAPTQTSDDSPYPPNALPGGRDVPTPYGNIRVYEWGPEEGRKVLFVHGISTPCIAFASMANLLVEQQGCRVLLFDLFGRGYSDTPDPAFFNQDVALWTTQILLVLASSPLAWMGSSRFTLVGYSMGGGIGAAFTSYFPSLVESLILIAPGGLMRPHHIAASSKLLYGGWLPDAVVNYYIYRRLKGGSGVPPGVGKPEAATAPAEAAESEVPVHPALAADSLAPVFPDRPRISPQNTVSWQVDAHPGFLPAFISSIKHAPISNEHERWRLIGRRQASSEGGAEGRLKEGRVLVLLGETDNVIVADEVEEDATEVLGKESVKVVRLAGAHDVPIVNAEGCVRAIEEFWSSR